MAMSDQTRFSIKKLWFIWSVGPEAAKRFDARRGSRVKYWDNAPTKSRCRVGYGERCALLSRLEGLGSRIRGRAWARNARWRIWRPHNVYFAPIFWCFEFTKQCYLSHLGVARPKFGGSCPRFPVHKLSFCLEYHQMSMCCWMEMMITVMMMARFQLIHDFTVF